MGVSKIDFFLGNSSQLPIEQAFSTAFRVGVQALQHPCLHVAAQHNRR
jgi:hypothetical protein